MTDEYGCLIKKSNLVDEYEADLSSLNILDGIKFAVLASADFIANHPNKTLKCHANEDLKTLANTFELRNLKFI